MFIMDEYSKIATILKKSADEERFRASIYVDLYIPKKELNEEIDEYEFTSVDELRKKAQEKAQEIADSIPNAYVGGVAHHPVGGGYNFELEKI